MSNVYNLPLLYAVIGSQPAAISFLHADGVTPLSLAGLTFAAIIQNASGVVSTFTPTAAGNVLTIQVPALDAVGQLQLACTATDGLHTRDLFSGALVVADADQPAVVSVTWSPGATISVS
jgi:hypothetical protein